MNASFDELRGMAEQYSQYTPLRKLGEGGVCVVFEVLDKINSRHCALKIMKQEIVKKACKFRREREIFQRFQLECQLGAMLSNEDLPGFPEVINLLLINDRNQEQAVDRPAMLMQYISGDSVKNLASKLDGMAVLAILCQVSDSLKELHDRDIVHGDLTPDNVMLDSGGHTWILDLGIARKLSGKWSDMVEDEQPVLGKVEYMAPEIAPGNALMTKESDVFTLGRFIRKLIPKQIHVISDEMEQLIRQMLSPLPEERPTIEIVRDGVWNEWERMNTGKSPAAFLADWQIQTSGSGTMLFQDPSDQVEPETIMVNLNNPKVDKDTEWIPAGGPESHQKQPVKSSWWRSRRAVIVGSFALVCFLVAGVWLWLETEDGVVLMEQDSEIISDSVLSDQVLTLAENGEYDRALGILEQAGFTGEDYLVQLVQAAKETAAGQ